MSEIKEKQYEIKLTYSELLTIDGRVSADAQNVIDVAKREAGYGFDLPVMNEILCKSEGLGKLTWTFKMIRSCPYCDKKYGYAKHSRSGRNHRKGDSNHKSPLYYSGVAFNEGFIVFAGSGDMCRDCFKTHKVMERMIDMILDRDLKIEIQRNDYKPTRYLKDEIRICYSCAQEMQESKMGRERTLMGDGIYPSSCPHCGAKTLLFGPSHKTTDKHMMIPADNLVLK